jgi:predicted dehydrogenase
VPSDASTSRKPNQRPVGLAVIGLGRIGEVHARNLTGRVVGAGLVGVADVDTSRASALADELCCVAGSVEELLSHADVEGIVIATPVATHLDLIREAAAAGKHVLCEKPFASQVEEAIDVLDLVRAAGIVLQVGFHRRFDPDYAEAHHRLARGDMGEPYLVRTSMRDMAPPAEEIVRAQAGGFVVDATGHDFDALRWLAGEIREVSAFGAALSSPLFESIGDHDNLVLVVRFASGALGVIDNSRVAGYGFECSTEILGSRGTLRVGDHHRHQFSILRDGREEFERVTDFIDRFEVAYRLELEAFARSVRSGRQQGASGVDGVAAVVLSQAAQRSLETGATTSLVEQPWYRRLLEG